MSQKNNLRKFFLRAFLCFAGLMLGVSVFTQKASVQNKSIPAPTPKPVVRANTNTKAANEIIRAANAVMKAVNTTANYLPAPTPTPPANSTIRGRVFYEDTGRAVKRAPIMLMNETAEDGPSSSPSALTDNEGNFVMKNVRGGTYYALVNAPGVVSPLAFVDFTMLRDRSAEKEVFTNAFVGFDKIFVDGLSEVNVQVPARRGGAIGGRVTYDDGDGAIGVKIEVLRKVEKGFVSVIPNFSTMFSMITGGAFQTDDRGVYRFSGLPAGEYIVKATEAISHGETTERNYDSFDSSLRRNSFLSIFYPDVSDTKSAQLITIQPGQEIGEINLTIPSRNFFKIEGKTVAQKDKTPVRARIVISQDGERNIFSVFDDMGRRQQQQSTLTDEQGNWKFKELPKGNYKLTIEPIETESEYRSTLGDYSNVNAMVRTEQNLPPKPKLAQKIYEITVEDKDLSEVIVELGYGATVSGMATVENTQEMPKYITVQARSEKGDLSVTDTIGRYYYEGSQKPNNIEREFKLENVPVGKVDFLVRLEEDDYYVKSMMLNGVDLLAKPFEIKEGDNLRNVQIILGKDAGKVKGVILNEQKEPLKYMSLSLVPVDAAKQRNQSFYREGRADGKGEFEIKAAPGEYAIILFDKNITSKKGDELYQWLGEAVKNAQKVTVKAGDTQTVTVTAKR